MTIVADPDIVMFPMIWAMTGVMGVNVSSTRTDTMLPVAPLFLVQAVPDVQAPVGALPAGSQLMYKVLMLPNGATIRFAAAVASVVSAAAVAGQTGPPG